MVSYDILILSVYALYSIFNAERLEFRYNTVSSSVNLREISLTKFLLYIWNANITNITLFLMPNVYSVHIKK